MTFRQFFTYFLTSKAQNPKNMRGTPLQNNFFMLANDLNKFFKKVKKKVYGFFSLLF